MSDLAASAVLSVEDLTIDIGGSSVVDGFSIQVARGEIVALVGESGCGKSLTAMAMLRLLPRGAAQTGGRIVLEGEDMSQYSERQMQSIRGDRISIIFQEPTASLDPLATVGSQIAEALSIHRSLTREDLRQQVLSMLDAVGIPDPERRLEQYPFELSGGMCQRIMIAIALICGPSVLVADEPTTALDVTIQAQILDLMKHLVVTRGTSVVLITHDMGVVADAAGRVIVMYAGRIAEVAAVDDLFRAPAHPYTALLLASVPRLDLPPKGRLAMIDGVVPSPGDFPTGCRFAGRCPLVRQRCRDEAPPLTAPPPTFTGAGRGAACWYSQEVPTLQAIPHG